MQALNETLDALEPVRGIRPTLCEAPKAQPRTYDADVVLRFDGIEGEMPFIGTDISPSGLFVQSNMLFEPGEELQVTLPGPDRRAIVARVRVATIELGSDGAAPGMGLVFTALSRTDWATLSAYAGTL